MRENLNIFTKFRLLLLTIHAISVAEYNALVVSITAHWVDLAASGPIVRGYRHRLDHLLFYCLLYYGDEHGCICGLSRSVHEELILADSGSATSQIRSEFSSALGWRVVSHRWLLPYRVHNAVVVAHL